jgi:hypothetical protein
VPLLQQPARQLPALQPPSVTVPQAPFWQVCPPVQVAHSAPFLPHCRLVVPPWQWPALSTQPVQFPPEHTPSALQVAPFWHFWQVVPLAPQALFAPWPTPGFWQVPVPSQQPVQLAELHAPPSVPASLTAPPQIPPVPHACPDWQVWQVIPPVPQALGAVPAEHEPDGVQQPLQLEGRHCAAVGPQDGATPTNTPSTNPSATQRNKFMISTSCRYPAGTRAAAS